MACAVGPTTRPGAAQAPAKGRNEHHGSGSPSLKTPTRTWARALLLGAIRVYQRWVSPYKGFCCAYRHHTGRASCSQLGHRAVRRHGVAGLVLLRQRLVLCGVAHRRYAPAPRLWAQAQRGTCDVGCDAPGDCEVPCNCDLLHGQSLGCDDFASCADCSGCDWPSRRRRPSRASREDERTVHLPPRSSGSTRPVDLDNGPRNSAGGIR